MPTHNDLLLGQIAVRKGILSLEQLMEALQEQGKDTPPGEITVRIRRYQRPLGVILVARGLLSDAQLLALLQEQKARLQLPADYINLPREQVLFGQISIREGFSSPAQVHKSLRIQSMMESVPPSESSGESKPAPRVPRLGQIMIERGYLMADQVLIVLRKQTKIILQCSECGCRYNITGYEDLRQYRCRRCGGSLGPLADLGDLGVDETGFLPPIATSIPPAGAGGTRIIRKPKAG